MLFVYTDGVPEATNEELNMYGTDRMLDVLNASSRQSPTEILEAVDLSVKQFVGPAEQFDDLTMLCLRYNGT
jgi:sigma-B regulation protein RsbU (phosphoserine phosphatase)